MTVDERLDAGGREISTWWPDVAAAALVTVFLVLVTGQIEPSAQEQALDAFGYALLVAAGASLALCRHRPVAVLTVVTVVLAAYVTRRYTGGPVFLTGWIALFALSWRMDRRSAVLGAVALTAALSGVSVLVDGGHLLLHLVFVGWSAAAVALGDALRNRRSYLRALEHHTRELERTREEEARRHVAEERLRIARDLHDGVAHAMATINVQAGVAAHVAERRPEAVPEALAAIQRASRDVLDELAALLGVLREDGGALDRAPTPGLEQIPPLVDSMREAHLPVSLVVEGATERVSKPIGTAAYRIVQESLTNVLRHAGPVATSVAVRAGAEGDLTVEVSDEGDATANEPEGGGGVGIRGMRERAESTGGTLRAGHRPSGGFAVRATWGGRR